jgi:hypothetical protein
MRKMTNLFGDRLVGKTIIAFTALPFISVYTKIWVEQDWTEPGIAVELLKSGVSKDEIVLGFRNPKKRPLTEFAVA